MQNRPKIQIGRSARVARARLGAAVILAGLLGWLAGPVLAQMPVLPTAADEQRQLESQLKDIENRIADYQRQLKQVGAKKNTLSNAIAELKSRQEELSLKAQQTRLQITGTEGAIARVQQDIDRNDLQVTALRQEIAGLLRKMRDQQGQTVIETLASSASLSDFFQRLFDLRTLNVRLTEAVQRLHSVSTDLAAQKAELDAQRDQQLELKFVLALQNQGLADNIAGQSSLLKKTRGQEAVYQKSLTDSQQRAKEIRNRIYSLLQVGRQISFAEAVQVANWASAQTGVRAAFLLAILTQESNLGRNVGTCNRAGDPPSKSWRVVMKPERDQTPFQTITKALGRDPDTTPVSCPMRDKSGNQIGWGGAMGPAQFIPSTWLGYAASVKAITGKPADPWDIRDAFLASGLKLAADGGTSQSGEWSAAMRYFSGSTNPAYSFYGDNVVATAQQYQNDIDEMNK